MFGGNVVEGGDLDCGDCVASCAAAGRRGSTGKTLGWVGGRLGSQRLEGRATEKRIDEASILLSCIVVVDEEKLNGD